jgi:hypothetical protein
MVDIIIEGKRRKLMGLSTKKPKGKKRKLMEIEVLYYLSKKKKSDDIPMIKII